MKISDRKKSNYQLLNRDEKLALKDQKQKIATSTCVTAIGILSGVLVILSNPAIATDFSFGDLFTCLFSFGSTFLGSFSTGKNIIDYSALKEEIYEKKGRAR